MSDYSFKLPDLGEGTVSAELIAWHVKPGDVVTEDQVIAEVMTDKASVELPSPVKGRVKAISGNPGDTIAVGSEFIVFELPHSTLQSATSKEGATARPAQIQTPREASTLQPPAVPLPTPQSSLLISSRVLASPSVRRMAREAGVDLNEVLGSGPGGRIRREDITRLATKQPEQIEPTEEIPLTGLRRRIAQRMVDAKRTIPHFAYADEVDVTELESLRAFANARQSKDSMLTYLPFIISALVRVLKQFPQCNAIYDSERGMVIRHRAVHVGIATQTRDGLVVPVIRNAESKSLFELAEEIRRLSAAAREKRSAPKDLSGSTITISSLGKLGGLFSTPIINAPEVAIIGVNKAVERPVVESGSIVVRRMMNLSSSFDHRFVDGRDAAAMIQALKDRIEHPATIFTDFA